VDPNSEAYHLKVEYRSNPKTGTQRGAYWCFYWREGGKQRSLYIGKTDDPEGALSSGNLVGEQGFLLIIQTMVAGYASKRSKKTGE